MKSSWPRARTGSKPRQKPSPPRPKRRLETQPAEPHLEDDAEVGAEVGTEVGAEVGPLRRCIVTREPGARARMLRFVLSPDRHVVADFAAKLPGRGMWLSARADVIEAARAKGQLARAFARAAKGPVVVPPDLPALLEAGLIRRVVDTVGLARRAGQAVAGFSKAREWVSAGKAALVLQASDGSPEERRRLLSGAPTANVAWPLDAAALGAIFGRDHAVHVAVASGRLALALDDEIYRLAGVTGRAMTKAGE